MLKPVTYQIVSPKIPAAFDGYRILHLSDLHSACFGKNNGALMKAVWNARPDCIVMTGDMVNGSDPHFHTFLNLTEILSSRWDTYYILGNHEQTLKSTQLADITGALEKTKVKTLFNTHVDLVRREGIIRLYGIHYHIRYYKDFRHDYNRWAYFTATDLKELAGTADPKVYNILLAHNPLSFPAYAKWGADLTLSGHIHGGIIRLPVLGGLLSPEFRFFPKYDGGLFQHDGHCLEVSRGLGNNFAWRINNPPELPVLILKAGPHV